jgi:hypothetical protein
LKKFVFQFEAPLKFRKNHRDLCRRLLAQVLSDQRSWAERRAALEQTRLDLLEELRQLNDGGSVDVDRAAARRYHAGYLLGEIRLVERNQELVSQQLELCQQALRRADQDVRSLENMRDKQWSEFCYQEERRETHEVEETWRATRLTRSAS